MHWEPVISDWNVPWNVHFRLQKATWSSAPPPTTPSPCGRTWSPSLCASTGRSRNPSTPSTCTAPRSWRGRWPTRSGFTPWPTSPRAPSAAQNWALRTSAARWPAWRCCPPRGCCCWAPRTAPSGCWLREPRSTLLALTSQRVVTKTPAVFPTALEDSGSGKLSFQRSSTSEGIAVTREPQMCAMHLSLQRPVDV